ncbi:MAG: peptide chain release factor-like protein [Coriobacteriia bacterium]|nr:peptide chain release factor-like protein [Coriobacteriia bacterium]MCL2537413.1 peptide chain release factor-like protein [Coriobacteriia bacterium]
MSAQLKYPVPKSDEELLRQCRVDVFRGSGPGGQGVNTADSAVRLVHEPSGITIVARTERSQLMNKRAALKRLRYQLAAANYVAPKRIATRPSKSADRRRLEAKKRTSDKKKSRKWTED